MDKATLDRRAAIEGFCGMKLPKCDGPVTPPSGNHHDVGWDQRIYDRDGNEILGGHYVSYDEEMGDDL